MPQVSTFVFFDIETTGLPFQERNQTKIIEASFVAAQRKDIEKTPFGFIPPINKLTFLLNPHRTIHSEVAKLTGITNKAVRHAPAFRDKFSSLHSFLDSLPQPVCLVAHNGNSFDYKILLAECIDADVSLPANLLCLDSLIGFRKLLKGTTIGYETLKLICPVEDELMTDDEDEEWPELDVSEQDWDEIDDICASLSDMSSEDPTDLVEVQNDKKKKSKKENVKPKSRDDVIKNVFKNKPSNPMETFKLADLYKRLLNKEAVNAHRAEADCIMLLECVVAFKDFLSWADEACKLLTEIKPLTRYCYRRGARY